MFKALFSFLLTSSAVAGTIDLVGRWHVVGNGIDAEVQLPGTLAANQVGRRWTPYDFTHTMDLEQSEALVEEWQYVGRAEYRREFELPAAIAGRELELSLERVMWASEVYLDGVKLGECDSLATPHRYSIAAARATAGRHELKIVVDNSPRYNFSRQSHAYGPNMQAVWNGMLGKLEINPANPLTRAQLFAAADGKLEVRGVPGVEVEVLGLTGRPEPWSPSNPRLYTARLKLGDFTREIRFGYRTLSTRSHSIMLNGHGFFPRGNIENCNFAKDGTPWMAKDQWVRMFSTLKREDGVDTFRFHSWCPGEAAFAAADEVGVFLQVEAGIWQDGWMKSGDAVGKGLPVDAFVRRELEAIAAAYGNHPSFLSLAIGNELGSSDFVGMEKMMAEVKVRDPRHLYFACTARKITAADDIAVSHRVEAAGKLAREKLLPHTDWDYEALYSAASVPTIAHEIGQWPVYPVWEDLFAPFTGTMRPWNLTRHWDTARHTGALRFTEKYHVASARLSRLIYKEEVESFLRTPSCAGVHLLNVQDYTGQAEALVGWRDPFYALKRGFVDQPSFGDVWGERCYLARFAKFTWTRGETFRARLQLRNLSDHSFKAGTEFVWRCDNAGGKVKLAAELAPNGLGELGEIALPLDEHTSLGKHTLYFGSNRWDFWVYPKETQAELPAGVVKTADPAAMLAALAAGKTVLYTGPSAKSARTRFKPVYWSARWFPVKNTTAARLGTWFDVRHPVFVGFPTECFTDWQWFSLEEGAVVHALAEGLPVDFLPIGLSVNDFHFSNFTASMFELLVGEGRLFVCGYDLDRDTPEARRLRASVFAYLAGPVAPGTSTMNLDWAKKMFSAAKVEANAETVFSEKFDWQGKAFRRTITGVSPVTGEVVIDFELPEAAFTSGRGNLDGKMFDVPFVSKKGERYSVRVPVIREDFLDGRLELEINLMTGRRLGITGIRIEKTN